MNKDYPVLLELDAAEQHTICNNTFVVGSSPAVDLPIAGAGLANKQFAIVTKGGEHFLQVNVSYAPTKLNGSLVEKVK
ncbi:MAG: hypothetical protein R3C10_23795 [Pirellulales bacterium]